MEDLLTKAIPSHPAPVLCIALDASALAEQMLPLVDDGGEVLQLALGGPETLADLDKGSIGTVVLRDALKTLDEDQLLALVRRCHEVLRDGGRLLLTDQLMPYDRMAPLTGRTFLRWLGVRYTSDEVFGLMERSGFWDCLVLRRGGLDSDVVVRGEKVVQHAHLDKSPTLSTNPTFRLIK